VKRIERVRSSSPRISRRTVLRGVGTAIALPWLEAMRPAFARSPHVIGAPRRMLFVYVPNGVNMRAWTPAAEGAAFALPPTLEPLAPHKPDLLVLSGLTQDKARANGDGPGDHARACAAFLTASQPFKTNGAEIHAGVSVDQVAARAIGNRTRFRSLEVGCEPSAQSGQCDSGYSCAYVSNVSWSTPHTPMPKETNPRLVFDRLFLGDDADETAVNRARRAKGRKSILDFVRDDAARLAGELGATDRRKLDEYTTSIREIERQIDLALEGGGPACEGAVRPTDSPASFAEHVRLMSDLVVLAFRCDVTRIATFMLGNEASNRSFAFIDVPESHHEISHHGNDEAKLAKVARIDRFHVEALAHLLQQMKESREESETLLDRSMIVYGSGISDGNRHNHDDLPILVAGRGGGTIATGRHVRHPKETPVANLYVALLDRMGVPVSSLGDSTARLSTLDA
jgi:hypothetical protein